MTGLGTHTHSNAPSVLGLLPVPGQDPFCSSPLSFQRREEGKKNRHPYHHETVEQELHTQNALHIVLRTFPISIISLALRRCCAVVTICSNISKDRKVFCASEHTSQDWNPIKDASRTKVTQTVCASTHK